MLRAKLAARTTPDEDRAKIQAILDIRAELATSANKPAKERRREHRVRVTAAKKVREAAATAKQLARDQARAAKLKATADAREARRVVRVNEALKRSYERRRIGFPLLGKTIRYWESKGHEATGIVDGIVLDKRGPRYMLRIKMANGIITHKTLGTIIGTIGETAEYDASVLREYAERQEAERDAGGARAKWLRTRIAKYTTELRSIENKVSII